MSFYVGLDSSTQSLTATVIEAAGSSRRVVFHHSLVFDKDLPHYRTTNGVHRHDDPLVVTSPPLMWVEALDRNPRCGWTRARAVSVRFWRMHLGEMMPSRD